MSNTNTKRTSNQPENGAAEMRIVLKNGNINVYHADGTLLLNFPAIKGDWDAIWAMLHSMA